MIPIAFRKNRSMIIAQLQAAPALGEEKPDLCRARPFADDRRVPALAAPALPCTRTNTMALPSALSRLIVPLGVGAFIFQSSIYDVPGMF